jgi:23S rRNA pseudouridine2605 synthase
MNPQDNDQQPPADPGAVPDAEAAPKPRKRRVSTKAAAVETVEVAEAPPPAPVPEAEAEAAPAKPKRTRRKAAAVADDATAQLALPIEPTPVAPDAASEPPAPASVVAPAHEAALVAPQSTPQADAPLASAKQAEPAAGAEGDAQPGEDAAEGSGDGAPGDDAPRRRSRNRRRGRRSGERAAGEQGASEGAEASPDEAPRRLAEPSGADDDEDDDDDAPSGEGTALAALPPADAGETFADVLSGAYDALPTEDLEAVPERRVLAAEPDAPKLHKVLAQAGIGSRRDMEQLIADGRVTVNGQPAHTGQRISFGDQIKVGGKPVKVRIVPPLPRVLAYHKPVGEVVTHDDPQHRPTVFRRLPRLPQGKWQSVGRLDINTEGLLLFTNSGEMAHQLMHPRFGVEREYAVRVLGTLDEDARETLLEGVDIDGQRAAFKSIADGGGEGANHWYRVVISEGRNREVRKLFDSVDLTVSRLIRIRYGCVVLPRGLKRGVFVDLNEAEVRELRRQAGGGRESQQGGPAPRQAQDGGGAGGKSRRNRRGGQGGGQGGGRDRNERNDRVVDRGDRGGERFERREPGEGGPIPNPLQQTFDKRAIREARQPRREYSEDGPIPNPLEQTYDKRHVQKQRGFGGGGGGGGRRQGGGEGGGGGQPDPMKTSLGYIGADAFVRKFQGGGGGGGGGRGGKRRGGR